MYLLLVFFCGFDLMGQIGRRCSLFVIRTRRILRGSLVMVARLLARVTGELSLRSCHVLPGG